MNKKTVLFFVLPVVLGGACVALAQEDITVTSATPSVVSEPVTAVASVPLIDGTQPTNIATSPQQEEKQMILDVGPEGKVLLRGTIASVSVGVITVKGWGGIWTVNIPTTAEILPEAVKKDITKFKVGDYVGVQGRVLNSVNWTINATLVRDRTRETIIPLRKEQKEQKVEIKKEKADERVNKEQQKKPQENISFKPTVLPQKIQGIFSNLKERMGQLVKPEPVEQPTVEPLTATAPTSAAIQ
ncbi:MAG: hypothetical protein NTZ13_03030 [Candidatus Parcubacteria bacterium]|nr:hypothetical protein [Candidatus Parcubacteria bacterium]